MGQWSHGPFLKKSAFFAPVFTNSIVADRYVPFAELLVFSDRSVQCFGALFTAANV